MSDQNSFVPRLDSALTTFVIAAGLATTIAVYAPDMISRAAQGTAGTAAASGVEPLTTQTTQSQSAAAQINAGQVPSEPVAHTSWAASANGRVEPRGGDVRLASLTAGRIEKVLVGVNDRVKAGDLLVRLDDTDVLPKLAAARAEAEARRRDRDTESVPKAAAERRAAEDAVSSAERALTVSRSDLDRILVDLRQKGTSIASVDAARFAVAATLSKLEAERAALAGILAQPGLPLPTRLDSAVATARAELSAAETALERTRLRAPADGTILQVFARPGETVTPSADAPLVVFGDLSGLRVRAEIEERDVGKVREGQAVVIRSDALPGVDVSGRVERVAQALNAPKLPTRGPRRPSDMDVLEVLVDVDGRPALLPGMKVDVFFRPEATVQRDLPASIN